MENMKNDLKVDIEVLAKLIQEMFPSGEKDSRGNSWWEQNKC